MIGFRNEFPYSDLHQLNLDWILKIVEDWGEQAEEINKKFNNMEEAFNDLKKYVNEYFNNLDVQEEINSKLDTMLEDGSLSELLSKYFNFFVSPEMFGAVGNGITDDTNSFIRCAESGLPIILERNKVYLISEAISLSVSIDGRGANVTSNNGKFPCFVYDSVSNIEIKNINFENIRQAIKISDSSNIVIRNIKAIYFAERAEESNFYSFCFLLQNCDNITIDDTNLECNSFFNPYVYNNGDGIHFTGGGKNIKISNTVIKHSGDDGIAFNAGEYSGHKDRNFENILIENVVFDDCYRSFRFNCSDYLKMENVLLTNIKSECVGVTSNGLGVGTIRIGLTGESSISSCSIKIENSTLNQKSDFEVIQNDKVDCDIEIDKVVFNRELNAKNYSQYIVITNNENSKVTIKNSRFIGVGSRIIYGNNANKLVARNIVVDSLIDAFVDSKMDSVFLDDIKVANWSGAAFLVQSKKLYANNIEVFHEVSQALFNMSIEGGKCFVSNTPNTNGYIVFVTANNCDVTIKDCGNSQGLLVSDLSFTVYYDTNITENANVLHVNGYSSGYTNVVARGIIRTNYPPKPYIGAAFLNSVDGLLRISTDGDTWRVLST